jgi:osmoprotectant transport system ATP-binding protein
VADFVGSDRGLKRLAVTRIDPADLEHPVELPPDMSLAEARKELVNRGHRWAVVVDGQGRLFGWLGTELDGDGTAGERAERLPAWVPVDADLKQAFSEMLQHDAGWVAVLDGDRYLGVMTPEALHAALRRSIAEDAASPSAGK